MMSTRSGRTRQSIVEASPPRTRKGVSPTRSPARNRKSSPSERSSQKSPSRKSPSRKPAPKYPARKSPSRAVKETKEVKKEPNKSPSKRPAIKKDVEVKLEVGSAKIEILRNTRTRRIEYSVADFPTDLPKTDLISSDLPKTDLISSEGLNGIEELEPRESLDIFSISLRNRRTVEGTPPRRSSRFKDVVDSVPDIRRSFSKSLSKSVSKSISHSIDDYSEEEDVTEKSKSQSVSRKLATPLPSSTLSPLSNRFEFGGRIGVTALYLLIPLTVVFILISCSKACSYKSLKELITYKSISLWFNTQATVLVISNLLLQTVFLSIPVMGTREVDDRGKKYYFNALFSSFCTLNLLFGLDYYSILKNHALLNSYLQMVTVSYIIAVILAVTMFLKSSKVQENDLNPYGNSGYVLYDFFIGREIHGVLVNINVKLWLARVSNISTLIFSILIFKQGFNFQEKDINNLSLDELKTILNNVHLKPTILVYSMMQIVYALYFIMREKKIVSTFYWNSEGLGYLQIVSSSLYPFYFTTISKYVADTDLQLTTNALIAASTLFLLGFLIMLISNNIKYEFRKNPLQPSLMHLNSMPTFHGKKLLLSSLWGVVRHPNYAGDMLIHVALAIPGIYSRQLIAAAPALITILMLLHRCWRDHARCRRRYGAAWLRYCKRVPSVILPKVL